MLHRLRAIARDNRAATAIEYGLIVSLIVVAIIGALQGFAGKTISMWTNVSTAVSGAS
ncbi:Flp family type IVb pilin [Sphingomonas antarctica]|uniref:Flp family type IVb pilin n=1 Tax=Sphingomonas antarctica TaxID=2040274 RepID=UPI0039EB495F